VKVLEDIHCFPKTAQNLAPLFTKLKIFHFNPEERYSQVSRLSDTRSSAKGPRGDVDMQAAKRDCNAPATCDLKLWLFGRQAGLSVMGVRVGVAWVKR